MIFANDVKYAYTLQYEFIVEIILLQRVIEKFGGKERVMQLMTHSDQQVRYEALLAVQKLMVHHW